MKRDINPKIVVVVLNYMNYLETEECVESVMKQKYEDYHILVVDNGSTNESYRYLRMKYCKNKSVSIIKTGKNYGFAKGNNIGIYYSKKFFHAEYVMLLNSDTIIFDNEYISKMIESDSSGVGVIGSRILTNNDTRGMMYKYVTFPATILYYFLTISKCKNYPLSQTILEKRLNKYKGDYILNGCILMLTPDYFRFYEGLDSRTFLYCEEELLYLRCKKVGLREKLNKEVYLYHKIGKSSELLYNNDEKVYLKLMLSSYKYVMWESVKIQLLKLFYKRNV